ncbi:unnamed protein product, partial [Amoebophrya sp. A120]
GVDLVDLCVASQKKINEVMDTKEELPMSVVDYMLQTGVAPCGSSFGNEAEAHQKGMHRTEVVREKWTQILRPPTKEQSEAKDAGEESVMQRSKKIVEHNGLKLPEHWETYDLVDNTGTIQ